MTREDIARAKGLVTDHAVLRYLERHVGIDVESVRADMARTVAAGVGLADLPPPSAIRKDGRSYVMKGGRCVTVYPKGVRAIPKEARA